MVADDKTVLEAVVSANEELVKLRKDVEANGEDGEKLTELYKRLQELESDSAEAHAAKILAGLGFTEDGQKISTGHSVVAGG